MLIKFINCKCIDNNLKVEIYNSKECITFNNIVNELYLKLKKGIYQLRLYNNHGYINTYSFLYKENEAISIYYNYYLKHKITIFLTDYHYKNLPIEKGEIILCQNK